jgi:glycosyltransferase involved in cell wall biosynthesis
MTSPRVSGIVPVYNGERFLSEALDSMLRQTRPPDEIIVVDDGSTDGTSRIAAALGPPVRWVRQENRGPAAARNLAIRLATGDFLAFLDADDLWLPRKLELQLACLEERPELDYCVTHLQNFWMPELAAEEAAFRGQPFAQPLPAFSFPSFLGRREMVDRVGPCREDLRVASDTEWFIRAREMGLAYEVLPEVLVRRRLHRGNLTRADLASSDTLVANLKASLDRRRKGAG